MHGFCVPLPTFHPHLQRNTDTSFCRTTDPNKNLISNLGPDVTIALVTTQVIQISMTPR